MTALNGPIVGVSAAAPKPPTPHLHEDHMRPRTPSDEPHLHHASPQSYLPSQPYLQQLHPPFPDGAAKSPQSPYSASAAGGGKTQTVFIHKLYDMLEDPSLVHLIWWSPSSDSFCLYPGEEFSNVLAQYFKHTNIASFIRQLNMYGFHKVNDNFQSDDKLAASLTKWEFRHSANQFRKGDVESLSLIKRKSSKVINPHKEIVNLKSLPPTSAAVDDKPPSPQTQLYHRAVYQQLCDQLSTAAANVSPKLPARPIYVPAVLGHHSHPVYPHSVAAMPVPHSPGSPPFPDLPAGSPSYFHQQPLAPLLRQPSVPTPMSLEQLVNLKLIEMSTAINGLRASHADMAARYDALAIAYQRSQADLLQLAEIVDKFHRDDPTDLSRNKTPIDRVTTPSHDASMSPMSVRPRQNDLATFKKELSRKIGSAPAPQERKPSSNYHLDDLSLTLSRAPALPIVPQHYPLNPNYTLYNNGELRHLNEEMPTRPSVLMDPLQPAPARAYPIEEKTASPLSSLGKEKEKDTHGGYVQQYQPKVQPQMHMYYQHIRHEAPGQLRTASLPIIEKPTAPQGALQQRHSVNSIAKARLTMGYESEKPQPGNYPLTPVSVHALTMPAVSSGPAGSALPGRGPPVAPLTAKKEEKEPVRQHLPSVLELNKLIMTGGLGSTSGRVLDLLLDNEGEDDKCKKRKVEGGF